jgi:hypothetical protein
MPVKVGNCPTKARRLRPFRSLVDSPDPSGLFSFAPDLVAASGEIAFSAALASKNGANSDRTLNAVNWSSAISTAPNTSRARSLRCSGVAALHAKGMLRRNSAAPEVCLEIGIVREQSDVFAGRNRLACPAMRV